MTGGRARKQRLAPLDVVGKTTRREHHGFACMNATRAFVGADHGPRDAGAVTQQCRHRRRRPQQDAKVLSGLRKARDQRHTVDQLQGPSMYRQIEQVPSETAGYVPGGF